MNRRLKMLALDQSHVMATGANDNDNPRCREGGSHVAMGHSADHGKAAAKWVAPDIHHDGVAVALKRWVLGNQAP